MLLDILLQRWRDTQATKRLLCKLLQKHCRTPRVLITDKLASDGAARQRSCPASNAGRIACTAVAIAR